MNTTMQIDDFVHSLQIMPSSVRRSSRSLRFSAFPRCCFRLRRVALPERAGMPFACPSLVPLLQYRDIRKSPGGMGKQKRTSCPLLRMREIVTVARRLRWRSRCTDSVAVLVLRERLNRHTISARYEAKQAKVNSHRPSIPHSYQRRLQHLSALHPSSPANPQSWSSLLPCPFPRWSPFRPSAWRGH